MAAVAALVCVLLVAVAPLQIGFVRADGGTAVTAAGAPFPKDPWSALHDRDAAPVEPTSAPVERVTQADLLAAAVPSLCGHPAGTLVDGMLPGIPEGDGVVWVFVDESGRIPAGRVAYGQIGQEPGVGAAVAVYCDKGGVGWPEAVVLYGPGPTYLGHVVLSDLAPGRQSVESLSISRGVVHVRFLDTYAPAEVGCCGRVDGTVELSLVDGELQVRNLELIAERPTAEQALGAAVAGDAAGLAEVATPDAATALLGLVQASSAAGGGPLAMGACTSPLAGAPEGTRATCTVTSADGATLVAHLHLSRTGFAAWQVIGAVAPPAVAQPS